MMQRQRHGYARSRTPSRDARRAPTAVDQEAARIAAARRVATAFIAARWPQLAGVSPTIALRPAAAPTNELLARLGLERDEVAACPGDAQYTFIYSGARPTADGADATMVAAVTVDDHQRIVKTSVTR